MPRTAESYKKAKLAYDKGASLKQAKAIAGGKPTKTIKPVTESSVNIQRFEQRPEQKIYDPTQDINILSEARKKKQIEGLHQRLKQQKIGIDEQRANIPQQYQEQRRQASAQSKIGAKSFGEFLSQRGLSRSGEAGQARLMQQMSLQQQLGGIGRQEQSELDRLGREERGLEQQHISDVDMAKAGIESDRMSQLIGAKQRLSDLERQEKIRQSELERQKKQDAFNRSRYMTEATGYYDPYAGERLTQEQKELVSPYERDYASQLQVETDPRMIELLQRARTEKILRDPALLQQYGSQFKTLQQRNTEDELAERNRAALANEKNRRLLANEKNRAALANERNRTTKVKAPKLDKNKAIADESATYRTYPVNQAIEFLEEDAQALISEYGIDTYKKIWNEALKNAIKLGQAKSYDDYYKPDIFGG